VVAPGVARTAARKFDHGDRVAQAAVVTTRCPTTAAGFAATLARAQAKNPRDPGGPTAAGRVPRAGVSRARGGELAGRGGGSRADRAGGSAAPRSPPRVSLRVGERRRRHAGGARRGPPTATAPRCSPTPPASSDARGAARPRRGARDPRAGVLRARPLPRLGDRMTRERSITSSGRAAAWCSATTRRPRPGSSTGVVVPGAGSSGSATTSRCCAISAALTRASARQFDLDDARTSRSRGRGRGDRRRSDDRAGDPPPGWPSAKEGEARSARTLLVPREPRGLRRVSA